jgi:hypothetical protein
LFQWQYRHRRCDIFTHIIVAIVFFFLGSAVATWVSVISDGRALDQLLADQQRLSDEFWAGYGKSIKGLVMEEYSKGEWHAFHSSDDARNFWSVLAVHNLGWYLVARDGEDYVYWTNTAGNRMRVSQADVGTPPKVHHHPTVATNRDEDWDC